MYVGVGIRCVLFLFAFVHLQYSLFCSYKYTVLCVPCAGELGDCDPLEHTPLLVSEFRFSPNQTEIMEADIYRKWAECRWAKKCAFQDSLSANTLSLELWNLSVWLLCLSRAACGWVSLALIKEWRSHSHSVRLKPPYWPHVNPADRNRPKRFS